MNAYDATTTLVALAILSRSEIPEISADAGQAYFNIVREFRPDLSEIDISEFLALVSASTDGVLETLK